MSEKSLLFKMILFFHLKISNSKFSITNEISITILNFGELFHIIFWILKLRLKKYFMLSSNFKLTNLSNLTLNLMLKFNHSIISLLTIFYLLNFVKERKSFFYISQKKKTKSVFNRFWWKKKIILLLNACFSFLKLLFKQYLTFLIFEKIFNFSFFS